MMQYFEWYLPNDKAFWRRVKEEAKSIKEAGIDAVWLPPAYKGGQGMYDVGYSVYDLFDLGEFYQKGTVATKYGTKDEYLDAIRELHANDIKVYADTVLGHRTGADEKEKTMAVIDDFKDRTKTIGEMRKVEVWTKYNFWGRNNQYSDFKLNWTNFHGIDYDELHHKTGIFRFIGKKWDKDVDNELGNYDYLLGADLDMSDEENIAELNKWGEWYVNMTNLDGFRLDAVKHISFKFYKNWIKLMREKFPDKDLYAVGEYWSDNVDKLTNYIKKTGRQIQLFDVPLHYNMYQASNSNGAFDMRNLFKDTLIEKDPKMAVTFVDNHDSQYGQALESWIREWFKPMAYAIILLRKDGFPCIFFGDYYGVPCQQIAPVNHIKKLISLRKTHAYGKEHMYFDHESVVGFTREGDKEHKESGLAVIMTNAEAGEKEMYIGKKFKGKKFYDCLGNIEEEVTINKDGYGVFKTLAGSISVWIKK